MQVKAYLYDKPLLCRHLRWEKTAAWLFISAIFYLLFSPLVYAACEVTDDMGNKVRLNQPAQRIISLAPDITEILFAVGAGQQVVGVISGSDYPEAARHLPEVGSYSGIDLERIISLHPDLIVTWSNTFARQLMALKKMHLPVYTTEPRHLEDVPHTMINLGCLTDRTTSANKAVKQYNARLKAIRERYHAKKPVTVFYQIGSYSLITINKDSWINQVITLCGGRNIFADSRTLAPEVGWEAVVTANPDVIVSSATSEDWKSRWANWPEMAAVKNHLLFTVNPDWIDRAGPRLLDGAAQLCEYLESGRKI